MSYILDALRKADSQRERDASRGIHAQAPSLGSASRAGVAPGRGGWIAAIAVAVVLIAAAGWYLTRREPPPAVAVATPPVAPPVMPAPATAITPPPPAPAPVQAREAAFTARALGPAPVAPAASAPAISAPAASAPAAAPITGGLPADAPRIAISGGVYSPNPAQRMLIVNGQVFNEGSEVAPGVKVEAIQARTAVLGFRGARYTVAY